MLLLYKGKANSGGNRSSFVTATKTVMASCKKKNDQSCMRGCLTVKILKIGTPEIITIIVLQLEQLDFTLQYCV